ncbi:hypothetical protein [Halalkalibacter oceani]|uniref:Uncharacterized protein n=1 Tax=Halalkalibacter oceani TaxID=1653776 RepID=A0A9X2IRA2_9BACI|nr:hypothetical protein [Halalkalibacter oceani]MCM3716242.1 hypothetical protein [Halalkalibacter oceani]
MFPNGSPPPYRNPYLYGQGQQQNQQGPPPNQFNQKKQQQAKAKNLASRLTPNEIAVIIALLTDALHVQSILVDRDQTVQVLLEGSLRKRSELDKLIDQVRDVPVGDFLSSLLNNPPRK